MNVLVVGSGGREHALAWKIAQSPRVGRIFVAPGNAGTARESGLTNVALTAIPELVAFATAERIALTVVGPEAPLAAGIVDAFQAAGLKVFGPTQSAAQLESSKDFAKAFMARHGIPTAAYQTFTDAPGVPNSLDPIAVTLKWDFNLKVTVRSGNQFASCQVHWMVTLNGSPHSSSTGISIVWTPTAAVLLGYINSNN